MIAAYPLTWPEGWPRTNYQGFRSVYMLAEGVIGI